MGNEYLIPVKNIGNRQIKRTNEEYAVPAILCVVVVGIFVGSIFSLLSEIKKDKSRSGIIDGVVVSDEIVQTGSTPGRRGRSSTNTYSRQIGWEFAIDGNKYYGHMNVGAFASYHKNGKIKLEYDPNKPSNNDVYSNFSNVGSYILCFFMGLVTILVCGGSAVWVFKY